VGATAADTKREIEEIRKDVSSAVSEVTRRIARAVSPRTYLEFAQENPAAVVGVGLGGLSLAGIVVARTVAESRRQNRPTERLRRGVMEAAEQLSEGVQQAWSAVPSMPVEVRIGTRDSDGADQQESAAKGSPQGTIKRLLWAGLVATMMTAGGLAARRLSATIWRKAMGEAPPTRNV
jgi:hypothetical protein